MAQPFKVINQYPRLPDLKSVKPEDLAALKQWANDLTQVLTRQFNQVATVIDTKADKP